MSEEQFAHPELAAVEVVDDSEDLSRGEVILKGALAAGAVYGTLMVGPFVRRALAASGGGDVEIVNFALTLEYLETAFYEEARKRAGAKGELKSLIDLIAKDERQHVEALTATVKQLGGKPVAEPTFDFPYSDTAGFLKLAQTFEDFRLVPGLVDRVVSCEALNKDRDFLFYDRDKGMPSGVTPILPA